MPPQISESIGSRRTTNMVSQSDVLKPATVCSKVKHHPNRNAIHAMYLITVLNFTSMSLFSPLVNRQVGDLAVPSLTMGIVGSVYGLSSLISSPLVSRSSDRYGAKSVFIVSIISTALNNFIQGGANSMLPFVVARGLAGFFKHTQSLGKIVLTGFITREEIPERFGHYNSFSSIGVIIGPAIAGMLIQLHNGYELICVLAVLIYIAQIWLFAMFVLKKKSFIQTDPAYAYDIKHDNEESSINSNRKSETPQRHLMLSIAAQFCFYFSTSCFRTNLPINLQNKYGTSVSTMGYLNSLQSFVGTLIGFAIGPVLKHVYKGNNRMMVVHAGALEVIGLLCLFTSTSFFVGALAILLVEITNSFLIVSTVALALENGGESSYILGLGRTATTLSLLLAPTMSGGIQAAFNYDAPAGLSASVALVGVLIAASTTASKKYQLYKDKIN